jgi:hypothetical protein
MSNDPSRVSLGSNLATVEAGMILCGFNKKPMAALSRPRIGIPSLVLSYAGL